MSSLTSFFDSDFNTQRDHWEKALLAELKLQEVGNKSLKKMMTGQSWPTLSLEARTEVRLSPSETWKKASNTYAHLHEDEVVSELTEDLKSGVRNFFFHEECLNAFKWNLIEEVLKDQTDAEVFVLGKGYSSNRIKVISNFISGQEVQDKGAHAIQELAVMAKNLVESLDRKEDFYIGVYVDSHFFQSIAKIRAARLLATKIVNEAKKENKIKIVALASYQGWTLFERYSNMLRNETAVAAAYIGGADHVQSAGYNTIIELEGDYNQEREHCERSRRMARNTSHVLGLESMLGVVEDAAFGSYHLENLTEAFCEEAWKIMQSLLSGADIENDVTKVRDQRLLMAKTRKTIMSGMNDYPDVKEHLKFQLREPKLFRVARAFEDLRLRMENIRKPEVSITYYGDYGALNARLNFVKNYFELLGLTVHENSDLDMTKRHEEIVVLCALDDQYEHLKQASESIKTQHKFIAGKIEMPGFTNLFAGQNVYDVLENIVVAFEGRK